MLYLSRCYPATSLDFAALPCTLPFLFASLASRLVSSFLLFLFLLPSALLHRCVSRRFKKKQKSPPTTNLPPSLRDCLYLMPTTSCLFLGPSPRVRVFPPFHCSSPLAAPFEVGCPSSSILFFFPSFLFAWTFSFYWT